MQHAYPVRPVAINTSHRVQSITPMPQVRRANNFRPMSQSPPPFDPKNRVTQLEDFFGNNQQGQSTNIELLTRGISILSIPQLRDLLRDYSLPTGGNKHVLVNRLIIFLETFGQNQQDFLSQFSAKLKGMLSTDRTEIITPINVVDEVPQQQLPADMAQSLLSETPTCLFEPSSVECPFGPNVIPPNYIGAKMSFTLPPAQDNLTPVLQFKPVFPDGTIQKIMFQVGGVFTTLMDNLLWCDVSGFVNRRVTILIMSVEPQIPVIVVVRWMKKVSISKLVEIISTKRERAPDSPPTESNSCTGICPLTRKIIKHPARGIHCAHPECFDLTGYLCYSIKNNSWSCPICQRTVTAEDLRVDISYFAKIRCQNT